MRRLDVDYATFGLVRDSIPVYWCGPQSAGGPGEYTLCLTTDRHFIVCVLRGQADKTDFEGQSWKVAGNRVTSVDDAEARGWYVGSARPRLPALTSDGLPSFAPQKGSGTRLNGYSYRLTDRTTWWRDAVRVVNEAPATSDNTIFQLAHTNVVDAYHGKITGEDLLLSPASFSYRVSVTVGGVAKTERDPHVGSGGDYTVDYAAGTVTFASAQAPGADVRVTYHYENGSTWVLKPSTGKQLRVVRGEAQFSDDVTVLDSVVYRAYGLVDVFAPNLTPDPYPSGTLIPIQDAFTYKTMQDYFNEANGSLPSYPALGGAGWRGAQKPTVVFQWDWAKAAVLRADYGMEMRVWLEHHAPFGPSAASVATFTFYCEEENIQS